VITLTHSLTPHSSSPPSLPQSLTHSLTYSLTHSHMKLLVLYTLIILLLTPHTTAKQPNAPHSHTHSHTHTLTPTPTTPLFPSLTEHRTWCFNMKSRYSITPGQSFGTLPRVMHELYLKAQCDQFFCQPNHGRGKFKCVPLPSLSSLPSLPLAEATGATGGTRDTPTGTTGTTGATGGTGGTGGGGDADI
jgi:hypothetical protein